MRIEFNPLHFDPRHPDTDGLENASKELVTEKSIPRAACYQVWKK
jgi:hypothetical protein